MNDREFLASFEDTSLPYAEWTHRAHVKVAYLYLRDHPFPEALAKIRAGIQRFNRARNVPEGPDRGYNETTTVAFARLVAATIAAYGSIFPTPDAERFCDTHPQLLQKQLLRFFYSPAQRMRPEAKTHFVEPDLASLPPIPDPSAAADDPLPPDSPAGAVSYTTSLRGVDWAQLKATLAADDFDNGRSPEALRRSFENSAVAVLAWADRRVVGKARALSDGVCNAYVVDVWTHTPFRRQGVATAMLERLLAHLEGQHVYLFTDDATELYRKVGFREQSTGMGQVVGNWLQRAPEPG